MQGKITYIQKERRFGFLRDLQSDNSYYINSADVQGPVNTGDIVEFEVYYSKSKDKVSAINVIVIKSKTHWRK